MIKKLKYTVLVSAVVLSGAFASAFFVVAQAGDVRPKLINGCMHNARGERNPEYAGIKNVFLVWQYRDAGKIRDISVLAEKKLQGTVVDFLEKNHAGCTSEKKVQIAAIDDSRLEKKDNITFRVKFHVTKDWATEDFVAILALDSYRPGYWAPLAKRSAATFQGLKRSEKDLEYWVDNALREHFAVYGPRDGNFGFVP